MRRAGGDALRRQVSELGSELEVGSMGSGGWTVCTGILPGDLAACWLL